MDLSEMQTRVAELEAANFCFACRFHYEENRQMARTISTTVGQRTRSGGRSIFLLTNWRISALRSSGGRRWSRS